LEGDLIHINTWLRPLSWLYELGVRMRNACFNAGILKETSFDLPVICIGNITVGGTGKTPHTEMLLRFLLPHHRVAVLSRGYKRKSRGFHLATEQSSVYDIGDEPWQIKQKFPDAIVAVDANRRHGIHCLLENEATKNVDVILLDDAYQHRYVKAGLNILLTDYHRLITDDEMLPAGRLREPLIAKERAHIVIVTKCPAKMTPMDFRVVQEALALKPYQKLFFSTFLYGKLYRLFGETAGQSEELTADTHILLLTGIALPQQMMMDLRRITRHITPLSFADHHEFSSHDLQNIEEAFTAMQGNKRLIVTTEKDAARLRLVQGLSTIVRRHIYVLPIEVSLLRGEKGLFEGTIRSFVNHHTLSSNGTRV
jgi:tetraacyldisaccharide 4'-kinase